MTDDLLDRMCAAHWQATVDSLEIDPAQRTACGYDALTDEQREISRTAMRAALAVMEAN